MSVKLLSIALILMEGCRTSPKTFVLDNTEKDKYYLSDSFKKAFKEGYIAKSPLLAINGIEFKYQKSLDTIFLPLKKNDITNITFLNRESSMLIYGSSFDKGAIVINTMATQNYTDDTIRSNISN